MCNGGEAPTKFELLINLKAAKWLGLDVPLRLQQLAERGGRVNTGQWPLLALRVDSLRRRTSDAIGAKRTYRERRERVIPTRMTRFGYLD